MPSKSQSHIYGLDGLRAIAIIMVFILHAWGHSGKPKITIDIANFSMVEIDTAIQFGARVGLDIFFTISGYLLSLPFWRHLLIMGKDNFPLKIKDFIRRRFLRIYPAYILAVIIYALLHDINHPFFVRAIHIITHSLLIHNLFEVTTSNISEPLWFVATLFQLYIILPFVLLFICSHLEKMNRLGQSQVKGLHLKN
jgi:peptidoglycan/LPS O-acetylase OafA/YrhL